MALNFTKDLGGLEEAFEREWGKEPQGENLMNKPLALLVSFTWREMTEAVVQLWVGSQGGLNIAGTAMRHISSPSHPPTHH